MANRKRPAVATRQIGSAVYGASSYFNHSCDPNLTFNIGPGKAICMKARSDLKAGQELCISYYGPHFYVVPKIERMKYVRIGLMKYWGDKNLFFRKEPIEILSFHLRHFWAYNWFGACTILKLLLKKRFCLNRNFTREMTTLTGSVAGVARARPQTSYYLAIFFLKINFFLCEMASWKLAQNSF